MTHPTLAGLLLTLGASVSTAAPPEVNLWVELRWVESAVSPAALSGARDGATVVGTAGSVSPRGGAVVTSTTTNSQMAARIEALPRMLVRNGQRAQWQWSQPAPLQWTPGAVAINAAGAVTQAYASAQRSGAEALSGFALTPLWPGGSAPVQVELQARQSGSDGAGSESLQSQVVLPLEAWLTVASSAVSPEPAITSTAAAPPRRSRELQLRVSRAP